MKRALLAATAITLLAGCATAGTGASAGPFEEATTDNEIRIEIQNLNFNDATVWALVQRGERIRLGTVGGKSDAVFNLPWKFSLPLRMEIDMVAGGRCQTEDIQVDPGDSLLLRIDPVLHNSDFCR
jgi:hypothetical protein